VFPREIGASKQVQALILAGGRGARLKGRDKPGLEVAGRAMVLRVYDAVRAASRDATVLIIGPEREATAGHVAVGELAVLPEPTPGGGPAAALEFGLGVLGGRARLTLVLAGDLPFAVTALPRLLEQSWSSTARDGAVLVDSDGRQQPLLGVYRTERLSAAVAAARQAATGSLFGVPLRAITDRLALAEVAAIGHEALDCDTPELLAQAERHARELWPPRSLRSGGMPDSC
jgi:molybdopterin-guanine dinucleotide biosynthesis protein A